MDVNDVRGTKSARSAFGKRGIDISMADVRVQHGVCFVRGTLKALPKWEIPNIEKEANQIATLLKRGAEIREVVLECTYKENYFANTKSIEPLPPHLRDKSSH